MHDQSLSSTELLRRYGIALTGGVATGKSYIAALLRNDGHLVIDADALARQVVAPGSSTLDAIIEAFGPKLLQRDGVLDRRHLRQIITADPPSRLRLEAITHPAIQAALIAELQSAGIMATPRFFFYEAALIFEAGRALNFRSVWASYCDPTIQRERLQLRDKISAEEASRLIATQMDAKEKARRADRIIRTDLGDKHLRRDLAEALATLQP